MAEQHHVMLSACDHLARLRTSTISDVITQTELTIPPPPTPAKALAPISQTIVCPLTISEST